MPKKTRREKVLAEQRKRERFLHIQNVVPPENKSIESIPIQIKEAAYQQLKTYLSDEEVVIKSYFFIDLRKSLILISFVIALEFFFYFVSIKNNFLRL